jgi:hypothetical protein
LNVNLNKRSIIKIYVKVTIDAYFTLM